MKKLRVGILTDDDQVPHWAYSMLEEILQGDYADIVLIVRKKEPQVKKPGFFQRLKNKYKVFFYFLYLRLEKKLYHPNFDAFALKSLSTLFPDTETMEVTCQEKKYSDIFEDKDVEHIRSRQIDVFIRLGFRILRGDILKAARYGIWSYHHGDNSLYRGGPAGCWEVFQQKKVVGSVLQILTEDLDNGAVLYRSWSAVYTLQNNTLNGFFWKTSQFIPRKLRELALSGWESFSARIAAENGGLQFYSGRNYTVPRNLEFIPMFFSLFWKWFRGKLHKVFYYDQWILLFSFGRYNTRPTTLYRYKRIVPPKNRYWADPCTIYYEGRHYIFYEEVIYQRNKEEGQICVMEINLQGEVVENKQILKKTYHLSSPTVFEYEGSYYMIPESSANSTIELYRAVNFPYEWEFVKNIMENVKAVDTTFFQKDGKCWLFTGLKRLPGTSSSEELFLYYSDSLLADHWTSHPMNPVVSDVRSARPAGKLFYHNNRLYRPSQDCSAHYGYSLMVNEVDQFTETEYKEHVSTCIRPEWEKDVMGTHTLNNDHNLFVIDALITRRKHWLKFSRS